MDGAAPGGSRGGVRGDAATVDGTPAATPAQVGAAERPWNNMSVYVVAVADVEQAELWAENERLKNVDETWTAEFGASTETDPSPGAAGCRKTSRRGALRRLALRCCSRTSNWP